MTEYHIPTLDELIELCISGNTIEILDEHLSESELAPTLGHFTGYFQIYNEVWGSFKHHNIDHYSNYCLNNLLKCCGYPSKIRYITYESDEKEERFRRLIFMATKIPLTLDESFSDLINKEIYILEPNIMRLMKKIDIVGIRAVLASRMVRTFLKKGNYNTVTKIWEELSKKYDWTFYTLSNPHWQYMIFRLIDAGILTEPLKSKKFNYYRTDSSGDTFKGKITVMMDLECGIWAAFRDTQDSDMAKYETALSPTDFQRFKQLRINCMAKIPVEMLKKLQSYDIVQLQPKL